MSSFDIILKKSTNSFVQGSFDWEKEGENGGLSGLGTYFKPNPLAKAFNLKLEMNFMKSLQ